MSASPTIDSRKRASWLGRTMKFLVPLVVTAGLCWLMFRQIDFRDMIDVIREECNFWWIACGLFVGIFAMVFRAMRWNIQLQALGINAPLKILVLSIFGTYAVNLVFPRLGEVWRTGYISQRQKAPFSTVFGSMVADRLADTFTVLLLMLVTFALASTHLAEYLSENRSTYENLLNMATSPWLWLTVAACVGVAWWAITRRCKEGSIFAKLQAFVKGLWEGFSVIATMPGKGRWLAYTVGIWGCYFMQLYIAFHAFPFTAQALESYGFIVALVAFVLSSISMGVPSNGGIGPYQWAIIFAVAPYGIGRTDAMAFANLVLGLQTALNIMLGIITFIAILLDRKKLSTES